ncbi:hypothetical protein CGRA01v4_01677 [Colletotrichum graminicola]|nr:hypothetical protein CGRA01v4_01677 [Colletotrichum graminicola]
MHANSTKDCNMSAPHPRSVFQNSLLTAWKDQIPRRLKQPANVVPSHEDKARRRSIKVGRMLTNSIE